MSEATYVYVLSDHGEDGAEHVVATLDRDAIKALLKSTWETWGDVETELDRLGDLLKRSDADLAWQEDGMGVHGHTLSNGWGGVMLHVVPLSSPAVSRDGPHHDD